MLLETKFFRVMRVMSMIGCRLPAASRNGVTPGLSAVGDIPTAAQNSNPPQDVSFILDQPPEAVSTVVNLPFSPE